MRLSVCSLGLVYATLPGILFIASMSVGIGSIFGSKNACPANNMIPTGLFGKSGWSKSGLLPTRYHCLMDFFFSHWVSKPLQLDRLFGFNGIREGLGDTAYRNENQSDRVHPHPDHRFCRDFLHVPPRCL